MKNKVLSAVLAVSILGSLAFGADSAAVQFSNKVFAAKKEASVKDSQIRDICMKIHNEMLDITKNMTPDQKDDFAKEFRMQMRKNIATLGKDEYFNPRVCGKFMSNKRMNSNYGMMGNGCGMMGAQNGGNGGMMGNANCIQDDCPYTK